MKKLMVTTVSLGLFISSSFAQGFFNFDNSANFGSASHLPTISGGGIPGQGNAGQVIGSDPTFATPNYDMTYFWMLGTTHSGQGLEPFQFINFGATQGEVDSFNGPTGNTAGGGGVVQAGFQEPTGPTGSPDGTLITIQLFAWYDPTGSGALPAHDAFGNYGVNVGWSQLETIRLATTGDPNVANISSIPAFSIRSVIPEPSIFTLSGMTAALMWVRRKQ